jgi:signal transduction histidine kinase
VESANPAAARAYAAALISAPDRHDVGRAFVDAGVAAAGARGGNLYLSRSGALHLLAPLGASEDALVPYRVMPSSADAPCAEAFRTAEPIWLGSAEAIEARFPAMLDLLRATGDEASAAEQLVRGAAGEREKRAVARLLRNARRMDRIVRDLVDYAQAQAEGRLYIVPREVDFHELCVRVLASLSSVHPERPVTYQRGEDGRGRWDPDRLEELLENLLVNALRYGAPDRPVYIGWYGEPTELVLKVHNHGPPIPPAVLPHVFDPFRRGEEHSVRDSLGLGLYIVRQIVSAHGGRVEVRSDRESGTTFVVRLPFAAQASPAHELAG